MFGVSAISTWLTPLLDLAGPVLSCAFVLSILQMAATGFRLVVLCRMLVIM